MVRICPQYRRPGFDPWVGKIPWRREWQPTPVFFPGESHGQRNLAGYTVHGVAESDTTEQLTHTQAHTREINRKKTINRKLQFRVCNCGKVPTQHGQESS